MFKSSLDTWFSHIQKIHTNRMELGLDRVGSVADRLQLTKFSCPVITVGGTNGKGSCTKALESIYHAAGYKTALYTSPHLVDFNERIRINNKNINDHDLIRAFEKIESARGDIILSFFEFTTLAALFLFQEAKPDVMILEVGLGGRLDAVNIVESDVAVVTSIALDHMDWLGDTLDAIAYEKACIARANKPFISGEENPPARLLQTARKKNAITYQIHRDFSYNILGNQFIYSENNQSYSFEMPHLKPQNMTTAIAAIKRLQKKLLVSEKQIALGLKNIILSGRFEKRDLPLPMILDVAHNPQASVWLAEQYAALPRVNKTVVVVGMLKDKAMIETIKPLLSLVDQWCVCSLVSVCHARGSDGFMILDFLKQQKKPCEYFLSVDDAMHFLTRAHCQDECDRALIFGSFYTVAAAIKYRENISWKKE